MIMTMNSVMMDGGRLVMKMPLLRSFVKLVATVADHKTAGVDLQRFFEGEKSAQIPEKNPAPGGVFRLAASTGRCVNLLQ
jgi:hypothetical protein